MSAGAVIRLPQPSQGPIPLSQLPPLALYIHLPWCIRKCPYCDFNSHEWRGEASVAAPAAGQAPMTRLNRATVPAPVSSLLPEALESQYLAALQADLEACLPLVWGRSVQTVFIGGGTPSLFSPAAIERLLAMVRARLRLAPQAEITLEANPGSYETGRFAGFAQAGVTRLSIGVQSFDDACLRAIGRVHDGAQARAAVAEAARHFETFNLDLMYALPNQTMADLENDLACALAFKPPHLSAYHLTLEPNTLFARFPPALPDDDLAADMQVHIEQRLALAGLAQYEISAYARAGHRSRHNLNYWQFGDYLGIGAGAHGKLSFHDGVVRYARFKQPQRYMAAALAGSAVEEERRLQAADLPFEFMLNALRLLEGVPAALFEERTGLPLSRMGRAMQSGCQAGLLAAEPAVIRATPLGLRFLNDLQERFLADS